MPSSKDLELAQAAYKTVREILCVQQGESLLITIDSVSEFRVAEEMAKAGQALGAKVMVAWHTTPRGYGKATDPYLPAPLIAACPEADAWIEEYRRLWEARLDRLDDYLRALQAQDGSESAGKPAKVKRKGAKRDGKK